MNENDTYTVEIKSSACANNPYIRSLFKRQRIWSFESKAAAQEWMDELQSTSKNELVLKNEFRAGGAADAVLESARAQTSWSGI